MRTPVYTTAFKKDTKLAKKRGLDIEALKAVMTLLIEDKPLPAKHVNHKLSGDWKDHWDCHIAPDWVLIYKLVPGEVIFARTGSHADLFG